MISRYRPGEADVVSLDKAMKICVILNICLMIVYIIQFGIQSVYFLRW